ncbi:PKD-like domain-containing protein [uncultured Mucilaginibacter sp.]|uniref:Ig-like domain-containing protein n=1 Tax=uncultured Mucilaginibacter sp. TaxID=797541 RepID=UPI00262D0D9A|nr:PKD-like domain-containing protein [uncultured Mucilaginibacter sp.]
MRRFLLLVAFIIAYAVSTKAQVPTINVDLSSSNIPWTYYSARGGYLCSDNTTTKCIIFNITLNPNTNLLNFTADQLTGASFYTVTYPGDQICGSHLYPIGTAACITPNSTNVIISFCKPGGNAVNYTITASSTVTASGPGTLRQGCTGAMTVTGLNTSGLTWTSVYPGAAGTYNAYLSCTSGCTTTYVTPAIGAPPYIDYQVSGTTTATNCVQSKTAVVRVYTFPPLNVTINPASAVICNGNPVTLAANVTGGNPAYTYSWAKDGQSISQTTSSITVSAAGNYTVTVADQIPNCPAVPQSVAVTAAQTPPVPTASNASTCANSTATLTATAPGGSYEWYNAATGGTPQGTGATFTTPALTANTTYYVQTTLNGCTSARTPVTVTVNQVPNAPTASGTTICSGSQATLTASGSTGSYQWFDAATGGNLLPANGASFTTPVLQNTTTYYVQTTVNGCTSTRTSVTVTVNQTPDAPTAAGINICSGGTATLTATAPGGSYQWFDVPSGGVPLPGNASFTTSFLTSTKTYYVQTTVNNCTSARTPVTVTVTPIPDAPTVSNTSVCSGSRATLTASGSTGSYAWFDVASGGTPLSGNASFTTSNLSSTTNYYVQTTVNGCTSSRTAVTVTVNQIPAAPTASGTTICSGNPATLTATAPGGTYNWYAASTGGTPLATNASFITQNLASTTTFYVDVTSADGCTSTRTPVTVTVNQIPAAPTASGTTICSGNPATLTATAPGGTYNWYTASTGGTPLATNASFTAQNLTSTTIFYVDVTSADGCVSSRTPVTVTVNQIPDVPTASGTTICSGNPTTLTATAPGGTYNWYAAASGGTPLATNASFTALNLSTTTTFYVDVTSADGCTSLRTPVTVTVNQIPAAPSVFGTPVCSGSQTTLTASGSNGSYAWFDAASGGNLLPASGASFTTPNLSSTTNYYVQTTVNGCTSSRTAVTVTVNQMPDAPTASGTTICSGNPATLTATASGGTYNWYAASTGGTSLTTNASFTIQNLTSTTTFYVDVTSADGCVSPRTPVTVTVTPPTDPTFQYSSNTFCKTGANPVPVIASTSGGTFSASAAGLVFADNQTGEIDLSRSTPGTYTVTFVTNTTCVYTSNTTVSITPGPDATFSYGGPYCQQQSNPLPTFPTSSSAGSFSCADADLVFASSSTGEINLQQTVPGTYTVRNDITASGGCAATFATGTITINPLPTVNAGMDKVVCSGETVPLNGTIGGGASSATWSGGTGTFSDVTSLQTVYTPGAGETNVTLYLTTNDPAGPCGFAVDEIKITINPTPAVTSDASNTVCNETDQTYVIKGNDVIGTTFNWSRAAVAGISNAAVSGQTSAAITEKLINTTPSPVAVTYTIVPEANNCTGLPFNYTVKVNPTPHISVSNEATGTVCNGTSQNYILAGDVAGTTVKWSRAAVNGISNAAVSNQSSNVISEALINTTNAPVAVNYLIVPTANGCTGPAFTYTVTVNPTLTINSAASGTVCSGTAQNYLIKSDVNNATFSWSRTSVTGISNPAVSGESSDRITESLVNTTSAPVVVTYTIIPSINGCAGDPFQYQVTVNPVATIRSVSNGTSCSGTAQGYTIKSDVNGATFNWSRAAVTGISNAAVSNQSGNSITEALINTTSAPIAVNYLIIPEANSCTGPVFTYTVTVNPTPAISNTSFSQVICSGETSVPVTLNSNISGTTFAWIATATNGISINTTSGTDVIPAQTFTNPGTTAATITYTVTPLHDGCIGETATFTITVNPKPATPVLSSNSPVCSGTSLMLNTATVDNATYNWTGPNGFTSHLQNPEIANVALASQGNYTLITSVNGCLSEDGTIAVVINPTPAAPVASGNGPVCAGEKLQLSASLISGASYSWTGPNSFTSSLQNPVIDQATVAASGTYTVKAMVNGCESAAGTIAVLVNPMPLTPTVSSNSPVCATTSLSLTASTITGASYQWAGPNGFTSSIQNPVIPAATPANAGTYSVLATVNGCTAPVASIAVVVNELPAQPVLSSNSPVCSGTSIEINCKSTDGGFYKWTGPNGFTSTLQNPVLANATAANQGRYTVVITTPGCTVVNTAFINIKVNQTPDAPSVSSNSPVCAGQNIKLTAAAIAGASYQWKGPNGFTSNLQNPEIASVNEAQAGKYSLTVTVNGCTSNAGITQVAVNQPPVVTAGVDQTACAGKPVATLSGSITGSTTTGSWTTSGSGTFTTGNTSLKGIYLASAADIANGGVVLTLTSTNTAPCAVASSSFKLNIIPFPVVAAGKDQEVCMGDVVNLNGKVSNAEGGTWSSSGTGVFNPSKTSLDARYIPSEKDKFDKSFVLTLTSTGNCAPISSQMKVQLVEPPKVDAGADLYVMQNEKIVLQPAVTGTGLTYSWAPNQQLSDSKSKTPVLTGQEDATYTLTVTGAAGCIAQDQVSIKVLKPIKIPNTFTPNGDGINDTWAIKELDSYPGITVKIFNRYGTQLFFSEGYGVPWNGTYNNQLLPFGTYYYIIDLKTHGKLLSGPVTILR